MYLDYLQNSYSQQDGCAIHKGTHLSGTQEETDRIMLAKQSLDFTICAFRDGDFLNVHRGPICVGTV